MMHRTLLFIRLRIGDRMKINKVNKKEIFKFVFYIGVSVVVVLIIGVVIKFVTGG